MKIAVLGSGSFGTTLANVLVNNGYQVKMWSIDSTAIDEINTKHRNQKYIGDCKLHLKLKATASIAEALENARYVLWAIPTQSIRSVLKKYVNYLQRIKYHINVAKGIEASTTKRVSEIFHEFNISKHRYCLLAGPSHAEEVINRQATAISAISDNLGLARNVQNFFSTTYLRIYTNSDLVASEMAGAFKNVVAIGAGICDGYGLGDNAKAALITRSLVELTRLVEKYDGKYETLNGLTGLGDLIATCCSQHSRNRHVGEELGKGRPLDSILSEMIMIAEGVKTCEAFHKLKADIEMPIVEAMYDIMFNQVSVKDTIYSLMTRSAKDEY